MYTSSSVVAVTGMWAGDGERFLLSEPGLEVLCAVPDSGTSLRGSPDLGGSLGGMPLDAAAL